MVPSDPFLYQRSMLCDVGDPATKGRSPPHSLSLGFYCVTCFRHLKKVEVAMLILRLSSGSLWLNFLQGPCVHHGTELSMFSGMKWHYRERYAMHPSRGYPKSDTPATPVYKQPGQIPQSKQNPHLHITLNCSILRLHVTHNNSLYSIVTLYNLLNCNSLFKKIFIFLFYGYLWENSIYYKRKDPLLTIMHHLKVGVY